MALILCNIMVDAVWWEGVVVVLVESYFSYFSLFLSILYLGLLFLSLFLSIADLSLYFVMFLVFELSFRFGFGVFSAI